MAGRSVLGFRAMDQVVLSNGVNYSKESEIPYMDIVTYHLFWTGDVAFAADLSIEGTLDGVLWVDLTEGLGLTMTGANGSIQWENIAANLKKIRVKIIKTAGNGTVIANFGAKARGV